jgi:thiol-disulfide isomerase/thioredoxin
MVWMGTHAVEPPGSRIAAVGDEVPEYRAVSLQGSRTSLEALRGHPVLLNVWSLWCAPCRAETPSLQRLYQTYREAGLEIVGVNVDPRGEDAIIGAFVRAAGMTYAVWRDPEQEISASFPSTGVPRSYLIASNGTLLWEHVGMIQGDDPELRRAVQDAVDPVAVSRSSPLR